jgi:hypothetical protein
MHVRWSRTTAVLVGLSSLVLLAFGLMLGLWSTRSAVPAEQDQPAERPSGPTTRSSSGRAGEEVGPQRPRSAALARVWEARRRGEREPTAASELFAQRFGESLASAGVDAEFVVDCEELPCVAIVDDARIVPRVNAIRSSLEEQYGGHPQVSAWSSEHVWPNGARLLLFMVEPSPKLGQPPELPARLVRLREELVDDVDPPPGETTGILDANPFGPGRDPE